MVNWLKEIMHVKLPLNSKMVQGIHYYSDQILFLFESTTSSMHWISINVCWMTEWFQSDSSKDKNVQISNLNTTWSLENRLHKYPYLQPGDLSIMRTIDFLTVASQLFKRNSTAMVAAVLWAAYWKDHIPWQNSGGLCVLGEISPEY